MTKIEDNFEENPNLIVQRESMNLDRVGVLIGKNGEVKKEIEAKLNVEMDIDSKNGEVVFSSEDGLNVFILTNIITAINFGQNPTNALKLIDEKYVIELLDVRDYLKDKDKKKLKVILGRIIGKNGATRRTIEDLTRCNVSIQDTKICVIGEYNSVVFIQKGIESLIRGSSHKSFYSYLEKNNDKEDMGLL